MFLITHTSHTEMSQRVIKINYLKAKNGIGTFFAIIRLSPQKSLAKGDLYQ